MPGTFSGGCACGAIRYRTQAEPMVMVNCHCRDCQRSTGSAYAAIMVLPASSVTLTGEPRYYKTVGDAGKAVERGFCPACGSPVSAKLERFPDAIGIYAASLDDPSAYQPTLEIFTSSAQPWTAMLSDTQKKPKGLAG
jgi:hypothetical protein